MTFIHSKLLIVDDRFVTVGSANATNRSMGLDTELNVSWEAADPDSGADLVAAIRHLRASLLAEHAGLFGKGEERQFEEIENLVQRLDYLVDDHEARLCRYEPDPLLKEGDLLDALQPVARVVDPERPVNGEFVFEALSKSQASSFAKGILKLSQLFIGL